MTKVYPRSLARRQIFAQRLAQEAFKENRNVESLTTDPPEISDGNQIGQQIPQRRNSRWGPVDWAIDILKKREKMDVIKKDR